MSSDDEVPGGDALAGRQRAVPAPPVSAHATPGLSLAVPADPGHVRQLRHRLRDWLAGQRLPPDFCADVLLAADEAVTNAVEHAYPDDHHGPVTLTAHRTDTDLVLTVADQGNWRPPPPDPGPRGHGLRIIRAIARHTDITARLGGTVTTAAIPLPPQPGRGHPRP